MSRHTTIVGMKSRVRNYNYSSNRTARDLSQCVQYNITFEPRYNEHRFSKVFPVPRQLAIENNGTKSSPQCSIGCKLHIGRGR